MRGFRLHSLIDARFRVERKLGDGVYRVRDLADLSRRKVLKLVGPNADGLGAVLELLRAAPHPGLPAVDPLLMLGDGRHAVAYAYVPGEPLHRHFLKPENRDPRRAAALARSALRALAGLERLGLVHGDIHPGNLIVRDGGCVLIDPGQMRVVPPAGVAAAIRRDARALGLAFARLLGDAAPPIVRRLAAGTAGTDAVPADEPPFVGRDELVARLSRLRRGGVYIGGIEGSGKTRLLRELRLAALKRGARIVLCDDVHLLDPAERDALFAADVPTVFAGPPGASPRSIARVVLGPLGRDAVAELMGPGADPERVDEIWTRSEGNPREAIRLMKGPRVDPLIRRRFRSLRREQRRAVSIICASPEPVTPARLRRATGCDDVPKWLARDSRGRLRPASVRIRNCVVAMLGPAARTPPADPHGRAQRLLAAGRPHEAIVLLREALASARTGRGALLRRLYDALRAAGRHAESLTAADALVRLRPSATHWRMKANAQKSLDHVEAALASYREAIARADRRARVAAESMIQSAYLLNKLDDAAGAEAMLDRAERCIEGVALRFKLHEARGTLAYYRHDYAGAQAAYRAALACAPDERLRANSQVNLALALYRTTQWIDAERLLKEAYRSLTALGRESDAAFCLDVLGGVDMDRGRPERAMGPMRAALRAFVRAGEAERAADVRSDLGQAHLLSGDAAGARRELSRARREFRRLGFEPRAAKAEAYLARAMIDEGRIAAASRLLARAVRSPNAEVQMVVAATEARLRIALRDADGAVAAARRAAERAQRLGDRVRNIDAELLECRGLLLLGGPVEAGRRLRAMRPLNRLQAAERTILRAEADLACGRRPRLGGVTDEVRAARLRLRAGMAAPEVPALLHRAWSEGRLADARDLAETLAEKSGRERHYRSIADAIGRQIGEEVPVKRIKTTEWGARLEELDSTSNPARALDAALKHTGAERGFVLRLTRDGRERIEAARRVAVDDGPSLTIARQAMASRAILRTADAAGDPRFLGAASVREHGIRSVLCAPLRAAGTTLGALYLDSRDVDRFEASHEADISMLAHQLAVGLGGRRPAPAALTAQSPAMDEVFARIRRFATAEGPVLITGETGVGKELVARALRRTGPFVAVDCGSLAESIFAAELFGHVRGAFTGADRDRPGFFGQADGGTLFLDEVGNTPPTIQAALLRALQEGTIRPVGGSRPRRVDVRIVAATNLPLADLVRAGRFREDLYYRLCALEIRVPPLRERPEDIPLLAHAFFGGDAHRVDQEVYEVLRGHSWPGNVRELRNAVLELTVRHPGRIRGSDARTALSGRAASDAPRDLNLRRARAELDAALVREAMRRAGGNRSEAARLLGVNRTHLYRLSHRRDS